LDDGSSGFAVAVITFANACFCLLKS